MQEVERLCDRVILISHGAIATEGTVAELNARSGCSDFEETFVQQAFTPQERAHGAHTTGGRS
jgi:sodium transport system ATP-binding protein